MAFQFFKECRAFASTFINISKKGLPKVQRENLGSKVDKAAAKEVTTDN